MFLNFLEQSVIIGSIFSLRGNYHNLWIECGVKTSDKIAKTIEDAKRAHHSRGGHDNTSHSNCGNEIDGVVTFL